MVAERAIRPLFEDPAQMVPMEQRGLHGYYKKPHPNCEYRCDGWVTVGAAFHPNRTHYEDKGFRYLGQYGQELPGVNDSPVGDGKIVDDRNFPYNPHVEPWRRILQRGGAKEFPICQIIAYQWHIAPPYSGVIFPQIQDLSITNEECPECDRVFSATNPRGAAAMLRQHLTSKINNSHMYLPTDLRELGKERGINFDSRRIGRSYKPEVNEQGDVPVLEPAPVAARNDAFICEQCGWAPLIGSRSPKGALVFHKRSHARKKEAVEA